MQGDSMLEVDLDDTGALVEQSVTWSCSMYARVASVKVHRDPSPFALIEMSRRGQTYEVAAQTRGIRLRHFRARASRAQDRLSRFISGRRDAACCHSPQQFAPARHPTFNPLSSVPHDALASAGFTHYSHLKQWLTATPVLR
jgi:hypothetical protein